MADRWFSCSSIATPARYRYRATLAAISAPAVQYRRQLIEHCTDHVYPDGDHDGTCTLPAAPPVESPPTTTTTPAGSGAGFYGEWGQHAMSITLAPDGSAHYAVSSGFDATSGEFNGIAWSATWSPMTSTTAMIVLTKQLDATGDTTGNRWSRYPGEALTFTLIAGGYATITEPPSDEPITLCPRNTGFQDRQLLCGA